MINLKLSEIQTFVTCLETSVDFYSNKLGFVLKEKTEEWAIFDLNGLEFVIMSGATSRDATFAYGKKPSTVLCLETQEIEKTVEKLKKMDIEFVTEIQTVPCGKYVAFKDPDGNFLELIERL